jgi:molybdenum cofactor cytidylyltransferase
MRIQTLDVKQAAGRILNRTILHACGKRWLARGHVISEGDAHMLETGGINEVSVAELEEGEIDENEAARRVALELSCGSIEIRLAAAGRANLFATEPCCVLVDDELLKQINCTASVAIATSANFTHAKTGQRISTVKSAPFAVPGSQLEVIVSIVKQGGPVLQARPIRSPSVAVVYTDPAGGERARQSFEAIMSQRLERLGTKVTFALAPVEEELAVAKALQHLLKVKPTVVLIASTTAPAGPKDVVGRAMERVGCQFERFLAPVEPGTLLLLGYKDDIPIVSAPGCFRSPKLNVLDLLLPPLLARYRVSGWDIACLGLGGLLRST